MKWLHYVKDLNHYTFLLVIVKLSAYLDHFHHHVKRHPAPLVEVCEVLVEQPLDLDSILLLGSSQQLLRSLLQLLHLLCS